MMNPVVHFEIPAKDKDKFTKFYTEVFGWKINDMPESKYALIYTTEVDDQYMPKQAGAINGGMIYDEVYSGLSPFLVIDVPDIDAYMKKVEKAGGKIVSPKLKVMDMGYYARFQDPNGVVLCIWENIKK